MLFIMQQICRRRSWPLYAFPGDIFCDNSRNQNGYNFTFAFVNTRLCLIIVFSNDRVIDAAWFISSDIRELQRGVMVSKLVSVDRLRPKSDFDPRWVLQKFQPCATSELCLENPLGTSTRCDGQQARLARSLMTEKSVRYLLGAPKLLALCLCLESHRIQRVAYFTCLQLLTEITSVQLRHTTQKQSTLCSLTISCET